MRNSGQALLEGLLMLCLVLPLFWGLTQVIRQQNRSLSYLQQRLAQGTADPLPRAQPEYWGRAPTIPEQGLEVK